MKKVLFFAVIVLCVSSVVKAQDIVNLRMDRQYMGLRGNVAYMDEDVLLRKDYFREDWPQRKWFVKDLRNVLREEEGRIVTFNPAGRMLTVTYTYKGQKGKSTSCSYTSNGLLTNFTGEGYRIQARYSGNMADINVFAETKDYSPKTDIAHADLDKTPFSLSYPFDLKCRQELTDDGLLLKSNYYYVDSIVARECEYKYNHNNLLTAERMIDYTTGEKDVSMTKYEYDNRGFLVKKTIHSKALDATITYENNELGDCTKMTVERPYGTVVYTFEYQYDDQNNWTVRLEFQDGVFDKATMRAFAYHKESAAKKPDNAKSSAVDKKKDKKKDEKVEKKKEKVDKKKDKAEKKKDNVEKKKEEPAVDKKAEKSEPALDKKAAKEAKAKAKAAEKERKALEKAAAKERAKAEKESKAAEKAAMKEQKAREKAAEKERKALEKAAEKERKAAEKAAKKK